MLETTFQAPWTLEMMALEGGRLEDAMLELVVKSNKARTREGDC